MILPVHPGAFSVRWLGDKGYRFQRLERWLPLRSWPEAMTLQVAGRSFRWERLLLQRIDGWLLGGNGEPFLRGLARAGRAWARRLGDRLRDGILPDWAPRATEVTPASRWAIEAAASQLEHDVTSDHELFAVYRAIHRLAARNGIALLYYTTQINEPDLLRRGVDPRLERNLAVIRAQIGSGPGVHFLDLRGESPPRFFSDHWHLTPEGVGHLAERLHGAALAIRDGRPVE